MVLYTSSNYVDVTYCRHGYLTVSEHASESGGLGSSPDQVV